MKKEFETIQGFDMAVKSLISLSFMPEGEILERFFELSDNFPPLTRMQDLITYFEINNIQGRDRGQGRGRVPPRYPPEMCNHFNFFFFFWSF